MNFKLGFTKNVVCHFDNVILMYHFVAYNKTQSQIYTCLIMPAGADSILEHKLQNHCLLGFQSDKNRETDCFCEQKGMLVDCEPR